MKHIIVGTAGHIDHGKTTLIRALTGVNTDRLEEEKKRGISIDLGFTHFDLSDQESVGIIDVPGHEKFLKNMLAGVSGMDMVLLVIAADEGIMPQTKEHLEILDLLGMEKGILVITKSDKMEEEWLELLEEDIRCNLQGTFLEDSPLVFVDSLSGRGLEKLKRTISQVYQEVRERDLTALPRLFIDRVFIMKGFGNVVTGTLVEGVFHQDDEVMVYPQQIPARIRGIQVHDRSVKEAFAGQRVALNLAGIDKEDLQRGDVLASLHSLIPSMMLDVKIKVLSDASRDIGHWDRIRLYHGAREILGRIVPLDGAILERGHEGYAQIRLEETLASRSGDKIILRFYSPMETVAGGIVVDPVASKHSNADEELISLLELKEKGDIHELIESYILEQNQFLTSKEIATGLQLQESVVENGLKVLLQRQHVEMTGSSMVHKEFLERLRRRSVSILEKYHRSFPLKAGMDKEEFRSRLEVRLRGRDYDSLLEVMEEKGWLLLRGRIISLKNFEVHLSQEQASLLDDLLKRIRKDRYAPPVLKELIKDPKMETVIEFAVDTAKVHRIGEELIYLPEIVEEFKEYIIETILKEGSITVAQLRDRYSFSRKYAVSILEHFDRIRLTKRVEDQRILI